MPRRETTFNNTLHVYQNSMYDVMQDMEPFVKEGEPMNWAVINRRYNTVEATISALPNAILVADELEDRMRKVMPNETLN